MVRPRTIDGLSVADAMRMRCDANQLLTRLLAERELSAQRCAENGKRDPMKQVTGASALDVAIHHARKMIADLDAFLAKNAVSIPEEDPAVVATITESLLAEPAAVSVAR